MQSNIDAEGFRSLRENEPVEFNIEEGEDGRTKAVNVTGPEGAAPQVRPVKPWHTCQLCHDFGGQVAGHPLV